MKLRVGDFGEFGTRRIETGMMFTFCAREGLDSRILLYRRSSLGLVADVTLPATCRIGDIYSVVISGADWANLCYRFIDAKGSYTDPYARATAGRDGWYETNRIGVDDGCFGYFDLEEMQPFDATTQILPQDTILYKMHMRGFTMQHGLPKAARGTDAGVTLLLPYLCELGVTSLEFQPIYDFEEVSYEKHTSLDDAGNIIESLLPTGKCNYWGYGKAQYFAPKASYFGGKDAVRRCRSMIRAIHDAGMEVILEMSFAEGTSEDLMLDCLWHWVRCYGVDGFHLIGCNVPLKRLMHSKRLSHTKLFLEDVPEDERMLQCTSKHVFCYKDDFMYVARQLQNHMEGSMVQFTNYLRRQNAKVGFVNYMASTGGFTLLDSYSYGEKHNEDNGEENRDGSNYNCTFNYGAEGETKNRSIRRMRLRQVRNGLCVTLLSQAVPLLASGDECLNSQGGNNNAYCQDNPTGWVQFALRSTEAKRMLFFTKQLIAFRKVHKVLTQEDAMQFSDYKHIGMPDLSYHGAEPWLMHIGEEQKAIGILYAGEYVDPAESDVYLAYNFHYDKARIALPKCGEGKKWMQVMNTAAEETFDFVPRPIEEQRCVDVYPQSITILISCVTEEE